MTRVVWKFQLKLNDNIQSIALPENSRILCVAMQDGLPTLWAEVSNPTHTQRIHRRRFRVFGTGWDIKDDNLVHVGTCMEHGFVWHVYQLTKPGELR